MSDKPIVTALFVRKCTNILCGEIYQSEMIRCETCGSRTRKPRIEQKTLLEETAKRVMRGVFHD